MSAVIEAPTSTEKRTLVTFVLDRSGSMHGQPINELNKAMNDFIDEIRTDPNFCQHIEVAVVSFDDKIEETMSPTLADDITNPVNLKADGLTHLVKAMNYAINLVENRKQYYKSCNLTYTRSFIVLVTDGEPNDSDVANSLPLLAQRIEQDTKAGKYILVCLGVGDHVDMDVLDFISGHINDGEDASGYLRIKPLKLQGTRFGDFFKFIAKSSKTVSATTGGASGDGISSETLPDWLLSD